MTVSGISTDTSFVRGTHLRKGRIWKCSGRRTGIITPNRLWGAIFTTSATAPGARKKIIVPDQDLGLALFIPRGESGEAFTDGLDHLIKLKTNLKSESAHWYVAAVWDQLHTEDLLGASTDAPHRNLNGTLMPAANTPPSRESFVAYVSAMSARMSAPATTGILSKAAQAEQPPADTLAPTQRTYKEAVALMRKSADRTAKTFESLVLKNDAAAMDKFQGSGFFTEGDNDGNWKEQKGYFWTGGFLSGRVVEIIRRHRRSKIQIPGHDVDRETVGK